MRKCTYCLGLLGALAATAVAANVGLSVNSTAGGSTLALQGQVFHTTPGEINNAFSLEIPYTGGVAAVWSEAHADGSTANFYAVSLDGLNVARVLETSNRLGVRYANFDPALDLPAVPAELAADAGNSTYLVQLYTQPLEGFQMALEDAGASIVGFVNENALIVQTHDPAALNQPFVRWVGALHPAYKLDEAVLAGLASDGADLIGTYSIGTFERGLESQQAIASQLEALGGSVMNFGEDSIRMTVYASPNMLLQIARMNEVSFIDPWAMGGPDMNIIRQLTGAVPTLTGAGYTGQGVRGEIFDTEVSASHPEWNGQTPLYHAANGNSGTHGSSCYGICFSTGVVQAAATGHLPSREQGIFCWYVNSTTFGGARTRLSMNAEATDPNGQFRSVFQTSSVGNPRTRNYTNLSAETDDYLFRVDYLSCQSMSNASLTPDTRPEAWAKNIIGVGGINHGSNLNRAFHSAAGSTGPAADNRIKPDLCAAYDGIYTTTSGSGYTQFGGTSGATPITCGAVGLIFQMWHEGVWQGSGGGNSVFDSRCKSTTARAIAFNTAERYPINQIQRDRTQGWGWINVGNAYTHREKMMIIDETDPILPLATNTYTVNVEAGEPSLNVTLVYIDPPSIPFANPTRINDLSLRVTGPGGAPVYWGNHNLRADNWSIPGGVEDNLNTTENVFIQNPAAGAWTVEVLGTLIVQDSHIETPVLDADYALVVRGVSLSTPGDMNCDGFVDNEDIDPFVLAVTQGQAAYQAAWPNCNYFNGDINGDGFVDNEDIDPFVALITGP